MDKNNSYFKATENIDLVRYIFREADMPEPIEKVNNQTGRVNWGTDNLYPQWLNRLYYENPVHCGIINQKVKFITAGGLDIEGIDKSVLDNGSGSQSIMEVIDSVCRDFEIGETQCWLFTKHIGTGVWSVAAMDYELIRVSENPVYFDFSENWASKLQGDKQGFRRIKSIYSITDEDTECLMRVITQPKQRSFVDQKELTSNYYPSVNYSGALTDIMSGIEMSFFTYSEVVNGFKGGTLVNLANGRPKTKEARREIERELKMTATDRNKQGGMVVTFSDGKERAPEVHTLNGNDLDKRYQEAKKAARDSIMVAHGVISPSLFGIFTESMFGSKEEMEIAYILFQENYVRTRQRQLIDPLNWALKKLNAFAGEIFFNDYIPAALGDQNIDTDNLSATRINGMSPLVATKVLNSMTTNEVRLLARLAPVDGGDSLPTAEAAAFSQEKDVAAEFSKCGVERSTRIVQFSKEYTTFENNEEEFKKDYIKSNFAADLTENQKVILTMVKDGESYNSIRNALKITGAQLSLELRALGSLKLLDGWNVTGKGDSQILPESKLKVLYSYEKRLGAPDLVKGGESRPFCETLIRLDRFYTREEIDTISINVQRDVWSYRGGWYRNPDTEVNTPSCRHSWVQNITVDV